ncbi:MULTISPECIES: FAD-dependent monooxygenase [Streptomyces]|uniref:Pentachlorophenol monooxygenase n=1 Tax=Streptomyces venezuelae (strain ATCC 10712 / CBS 650.69 / DSM 40230 / JCM 4526 / NBRC 13096 / PD 04745) TaxID=953739 RepID=F2RK78_STRVP|nr:FAD-dependent monooxygenase [Streptomyces venezuelae]APE25587.1 pentachlorophenol monooxygenase [Streptomyces venezuelae]QES02927.1 FAD-binding protein [Streptomyces venezuelae ATCC 10712]CCA60234.1 Pentachlorophenol monooxygenase [Streptomyces venezuelae ATCC 10712]
MARTGTTTDVLIVGAGPVGLSAAAELRRQGVRCRLVDRLPARLPYAKAVGIQPRTLELWDRMGLARDVLEAAVPMRGQLLFINGREAARVVLQLPPEVPYGFAALPQYETERLLEAHLAGLGTEIERGTELLSFTQDPDGVTARLRTAAGADEELRVPYLIGCDGAHSVVRKTLGLSYEGGAFPETYMLGDVLADAEWGLPEGYALRSEHRSDDGSADDVLVCIPLPGAGRYRMSMKVPPELAGAGRAPADGVAHGLDGGDGPDLSQLQSVVDRLAPGPARLSGLRWASVFRISHRIVDRYGEGRVFVAGDAAHIHPPTGAQGMNTGIQDAVNLAWKLALVVRGEAGHALLGSYDAERRPVGEEVVGRTVRHATQGMQNDPEDRRTLAFREAQLLVAYRDGPLAGGPYGPLDAPQPGDRAPDCTGLTLPIAVGPLRLLDVLRGRPGHVALLYGPDAVELGRAATDTARTCGDLLDRLPLDVLAVLPREARPSDEVLPDVPVYLDAAGEFARLYLPDGATGFVVRPDGQLAARFPLGGAAAALSDYLRALSAVVT